MLSFLIEPFKPMLHHRRILVRTGIAEVRQRYAGSIIGLFWLALAPVLLLTLYSFIYLVVFRVRPSDLDPYEYVLYILSGLVPFLGFSDALTSGTSSLSLNRVLLLSTVFPSELVPLRTVAASQGGTAVGLVLMIFGALVLGKLSWAALLVPLIFLLQMMFVLGVVWVLSLASLLLRDIQQMLVFVTMVVMVGSPIAYTPQMVPESVKLILYLNPLSYFVIGFHETIVFGRVPPAPIIAAMVGLALGSFTIGFAIFQRAKRVFFDYV